MAHSLKTTAQRGFPIGGLKPIKVPMKLEPVWSISEKTTKETLSDALETINKWGYLDPFLSQKALMEIVGYNIEKVLEDLETIQEVAENYTIESLWYQKE